MLPAVADLVSRHIMRTVNLSAWVAATVMLCSTPLMASENNAIPQRFHARIGGFLGDTYEVQLQDGCLQYARSGGGHESKRTRVCPTMEQWREFRRALDAIGVWRWRAQYSTPGVSDGTQWSLDITYPDRAVSAQGNNAYPGDTLDPSGSKAFTRYLKAVQRLLGGIAFE
jgi:hypothetical protein